MELIIFMRIISIILGLIIISTLVLLHIWRQILIQLLRQLNIMQIPIIKYLKFFNYRIKFSSIFRQVYRYHRWKKHTRKPLLYDYILHMMEVKVTISSIKGKTDIFLKFFTVWTPIERYLVKRDSSCCGDSIDIRWTNKFDINKCE